MKLMLHIVRKDFRKLRWMVLLWYVLSVIQMIMVSFEYSDAKSLASSIVTNRSIGIISGYYINITFENLLVMLEILAFATLVLIIATLIQEDSLMGTTAFWTTRPISPRILLAAKSLFVVGIMILPMLLLDALMFLFNDVAVKDALVVMGETLLTQKLVWALIIMSIASITPSISRLAVVGICVAAFATILMNAIVYSRSLYGSLYIQTNVARSAGILSALSVIVFGAILIYNQFKTRETFRSAMVLFLGITSWVATATVLSANLFSGRLQPINPKDYDTSKVEASLVYDVVYRDLPHALEPEGIDSLTGGFIYSNVEKGFIVEPVSVQSTLSFNDGTIMTSNAAYGRPLMNDFIYPEGNHLNTEFENVLGKIDVINPERIRIPMKRVEIVNFGDGQYQKYLDVPGVLRSTILSSASKIRIAGELPLKRGARYVRGSDHITLLDIKKTQYAVVVSLVYKYLRTRFLDQRMEPICVLLVNRNKGQAFVGTIPRGRTRGFISSVPPHKFPFYMSYSDYFFEYTDNPHPQIDESWLRDATLVVLDKEMRGTFVKEIQDEHFLLPPESEQLGYP